MTEISLPWSGTSVGDAGPYTDDQWAELWRNVIAADSNNQGVLFGVSDSLDVYQVAGLHCHVKTGCALVYGRLYKNDAEIGFDVVAPGAGTNYYLVVLSAVWATQTIRLVLLGPNPAMLPTVTQTAGTKWEIKLAYITVTSVGVVTVFDARTYINKNAVQWRQGGDPVIWNVQGTTNYVAPPSKVQSGVIRLPLGAPNVSVTFPVTFPYQPIVLITPLAAASVHQFVVTTTLTTGFTVSTHDGTNAEANIDIMWMAVGPQYI